MYLSHSPVLPTLAWPRTAIRTLGFCPRRRFERRNLRALWPGDGIVLWWKAKWRQIRKAKPKMMKRWLSSSKSYFLKLYVPVRFSRCLSVDTIVKELVKRCVWNRCSHSPPGRRCRREWVGRRTDERPSRALGFSSSSSSKRGREGEREVQEPSASARATSLLVERAQQRCHLLKAGKEYERRSRRWSSLKLRTEALAALTMVWFTSFDRLLSSRIKLTSHLSPISASHRHVS